ncbi:putative insertion sequence ATP-binding protein y4pL (plasmid) [Rhizobium grahamii CCGE 502]|uniref:Putative insertion sequence ATP-binding protein y4pL n=1 Tax=Rhizobium grahamii CCGE 502 TaxID=990285 RepID=S3H3L3_9HYPH|nr:putative insertion sequence ATP-binding protein y4pL [Rhizobium grahamii CCGE 502]
MFSNLFKTDLLILDDWGLEKLNDDQRAISSRTSKTATSGDRRTSSARCAWIAGTRLLQTQCSPMPSWILVHNAYRIDLSGEGMRKQRSPGAPEHLEEAFRVSEPLFPEVGILLRPRNALPFLLGTGVGHGGNGKLNAGVVSQLICWIILKGPDAGLSRDRLPRKAVGL